MNNSCQNSNCSADGLVLYSAILAIIISRNLDINEIDLLSTLLQAVGQNMAILASASNFCDTSSSDTSNNTTSA